MSFFLSKCHANEVSLTCFTFKEMENLLFTTHAEKDTKILWSIFWNKERTRTSKAKEARVSMSLSAQDKRKLQNYWKCTANSNLRKIVCRADNPLCRCLLKVQTFLDSIEEETLSPDLGATRKKNTQVRRPRAGYLSLSEFGGKYILLCSNLVFRWTSYSFVFEYMESSPRVSQGEWRRIRR